MKATKTVAQSLCVRKSAHKLNSRPPATIHFRRLFTRDHGVIVLAGYGIKVSVERGHLILEDGIGQDRRSGRFPRVYHGLRRVVAIGSDGFVSLAALKWLADQNIPFVMLERDGFTLHSTGPVALSDTRLRRAQALAQDSPVAVEIVRELIRQKLSGQEAIVREKLHDAVVANAIASFRSHLAAADTIGAVRQIEGKAATIYWSAWRSISAEFPKSESLRVPDHWRTFDTRQSPLSYNARKATNPINAILNYLYTALEAETRLAINALGLDAGFGLLHANAATRDSLVYDLMEPVRPVVDAYVLDWVRSSPLKRALFFEMADGICRLMAPLVVQLSESMMTWRAHVAPIVEWFAQQLCSCMTELQNVRGPGTRLTQRRRRTKAAAIPVPMEIAELPPIQNFCRTCGDPISSNNRYCGPCAAKGSTEAMLTASAASRNPASFKKRSDKMQAHCASRRNWSPDKLPAWLTADVYATRVQPLLREMSRAVIQRALGVSPLYARNIASGKVIPHKRHWVKLGELVEMPRIGENGEK
jgi:CRISPR-associated endonuclease Cas1